MTQLTPQQRAIVGHDYGPALVFAVAGAGKTMAIVHRIVRLVNERVFPAEQILATTFNKEAAETLRKRVGAQRPDTRVNITTLHALGLRIVKRAVKAGRLRYLRPLDEQNIEVNDRPILYAALRTARSRKLPFSSFLDSYDEDDFLAYVSTCKGNLAYPDLESTELPPDCAAVQATAPLSNPWYLDLYKLYEECRVEMGLITYDDMLMTSWQVLVEDPAILAEYQRTFQCVIVDEFQDVNLAQSELLDLLTATHRNYMAVGDDDQTIYEWRGASSDFILNFVERYNAKRYYMTENFRCKAGAIVLANKSIAHNKKREPKSLGLTQGFDGITQVAGLKGPSLTAKAIVDTIRERLAAGSTPDQMRILVRSYAHTPHIEQSLIRAGIPYQVLANKPFYERTEVQALLEYFRVARLEIQLRGGTHLVREHIELLQSGWHQIYRQPNRSISGAVADDILQRAMRPGSCLAAAMNSVCDEIAGSWLVEKIRSLNDVLDWLVETWPPGQYSNMRAKWVIEQLEATLKYKDWLVRRSGSSQNGIDRADTIDALIEYADEFDTLAKFMEHMEQLPKSGGKGKRTSQPDPDKIVLQSIHTAKGQEWPIVFVPACNAGAFPNLRAGNIEEERRLFYVALTRAQKELHVYHDADRKISPFLVESEHDVVLPALHQVRQAAGKLPQDWSPHDAVAVAVWADRVGVNTYFLNGWWGEPAEQRQAAAQRVMSCYDVATPLNLNPYLGCRGESMAFWSSALNGGSALPAPQELAEALIALVPKEVQPAARKAWVDYQASKRAAQRAQARSAQDQEPSSPPSGSQAMPDQPSQQPSQAGLSPEQRMRIERLSLLQQLGRGQAGSVGPAPSTPPILPVGPGQAPTPLATPLPASAPQQAAAPSKRAYSDEPPDWLDLPLPEEPPEEWFEDHTPAGYGAPSASSSSAPAVGQPHTTGAGASATKGVDPAQSSSPSVPNVQTQPSYTKPPEWGKSSSIPAGGRHSQSGRAGRTAVVIGVLGIVAVLFFLNRHLFDSLKSPTAGSQRTASVAELVSKRSEPAPATGASVGSVAVKIILVNKLKEYVDIRNDGESAVDLAGWILRSETGWQECPLRGSLAPGETLRIWAKFGIGGFQCNFDSNIWNNLEADPAVLLAPDGSEVSRY